MGGQDSVFYQPTKPPVLVVSQGFFRGPLVQNGHFLNAPADSFFAAVRAELATGVNLAQALFQGNDHHLGEAFSGRVSNFTGQPVRFVIFSISF